MLPNCSEKAKLVFDLIAIKRKVERGNDGGYWHADEGSAIFFNKLKLLGIFFGFIFKYKIT